MITMITTIKLITQPSPHIVTFISFFLSETLNKELCKSLHSTSDKLPIFVVLKFTGRVIKKGLLAGAQETDICT